MPTRGIGQRRRAARRGHFLEAAEVERRLSPTPAAAQVARRLTYGACVAWGARGVCDDALLVVSELVGNAVRHGAGTNVVLRLAMTPRRLRVEVGDASDRSPQPRFPGPAAESGRGLRLVNAVSTRWGVTPERRGKRVWAEFALPSGSRSPAQAEGPVQQ